MGRLAEDRAYTLDTEQGGFAYSTVTNVARINILPRRDADRNRLHALLLTPETARELHGMLGRYLARMGSREE